MTESELSWGCQCPSKCGKVMFPLGLCVVAEECGYIALSSRSPGAAVPQLPWAGAAEASHGVSNVQPAQPPLHSCSLRATLGCSHKAPGHGQKPQWLCPAGLSPAS